MALFSIVRATEIVGIKIWRFSETLYAQGPILCALRPLFCALVREEDIFAVCKWCAKEGFTCMCKEIVYFNTRGQIGPLAHWECENAALTLDLCLPASPAGSCCIFTRPVSKSPVWPYVSNHIYFYKRMRNPSWCTVYRHRKCAATQLHSTAVKTTILTW